MTKALKGKYGVDIERYVNIKRVSAYTSLSVKTLYEWASVGSIPSIKIGRRVLFDLHDIDEVMTSLKRTNKRHEQTINNIVEKVCDSDI